MDSQPIAATVRRVARRCIHGHEPLRYVSGSCVECSREAGRRYRKKNPGLVSRRVRLLRQSNPEHHKRMARKRRGLPDPTRAEPQLCECCGRTPTAKGMCIDHDHVTGCFRGWLCSNCNTAIGKLGDNIQGVTRALQYLQRIGRVYG